MLSDEAMASVRIIGATLDMTLFKAVIEDAEILRDIGTDGRS
jgi:hypothetical protein